MAERTDTLVRHLAPDDSVTAELAAGLLGGDAALADELRAAAADDPLDVLLAVREDLLAAALLGELVPEGYRVLRLGAADADGAGAARLLDELAWIVGDGVVEVLAGPADLAEAGPLAQVLEGAGFEPDAQDGTATGLLVRRPPVAPDMYWSLSELVDHLRACRLEHVVRTPGEWLQTAVRRGRRRAVVDVGWDAAGGEVLVLRQAPPVGFEARLPLDPAGVVSHADLFAAIDAAVGAAAEAPPAPARPAPSLLQLPISSR